MNLEQWIRSIPKPVLIISIMAIGAFVAWRSAPPSDYCDNQVEIFMHDLKGTLYPTPAKRLLLSPRFSSSVKQCYATNTMGGCYEMFSSLQKITNQLSVAIPECQKKIMENTSALSAMQQGVKVMAEIAWGEEPPSMGNDRFGWLQISELKIFCEMKKYAQIAWQEDPENWEKLENAILSGLKDIKKIPREEVYQRSLFSVPCQNL